MEEPSGLERRMDSQRRSEDNREPERGNAVNPWEMQESAL
jgi:hypothetical protein